MNSKAPPDGRDESPATLGDILYADRSPTVSEQDWVRLVEATAAGDQLALQALYARTHRLVFTLALRICGSREIAEEVTLDVFHDVWRRSAHYDPKGGSVVGWIMNQARSRSIDRVRYEQRKKRVAPHGDGRPDGGEVSCAEGAEGAEGAEAAIDARHRRARLEAALNALTPDEREAIETAFFSELTYAETAARLEQPLGTVKTRVRSALAKLRAALGGKGSDS